MRSHERHSYTPSVLYSSGGSPQAANVSEHVCLCPSLSVSVYQVGRLKQLTALNLFGCENVSDAGIAHVAALQDLAQLNVRDGNITDKGAPSFATLSFSVCSFIEVISVSWGNFSSQVCSSIQYNTVNHWGNALQTDKVVRSIGA